MSYDWVLLDRVGKVALITLNRPDNGNAYTAGMGKDLTAAVTEADADSDVRVIVVTGAGRHFCVGVDLSPGADNRLVWFRRGETEKVEEESAQEEKFRPWELATPVIGAINGSAVGVGLTLPLQWDIRVAAEDAKLGIPFTRRGVIPELTSTWMLARLIGASSALDLILTGRLFSGTEAAAMGLVNEAVPRGKVLDRAMEIAADLAANTAPAALAAAKRVFYTALMSDDREEAWSREIDVFAQLAAQPDAAEAASAFLEKRRPQWSGNKHDFDLTRDSGR